MIDIPEEVKGLFRLDGIKKNIRVRFPNGEYPDLVNDDIVKGSVSFTESLCSQENLKFGLCESSLFEFQCSGIGNAKGCTISACLEIDCSPLGFEWCLDNAMTSSDVAFPFYRIEYGVFVIESCKKGSNGIRKVEAYTATSDKTWELCNLELRKQRFARTTGGSAYAKTYKFDVFRFLISNGYLSGDGYPRTEIETASWSMGGQGGYATGGPYGTGQLIFHMDRVRYVMPTLADTDALFTYTNPYPDTVARARAEIEALYERIKRMGYVISDTDMRVFRSMYNNILGPHIEGPGGDLYADQGQDYIYPYISMDKYSREMEIYLPVSIHLFLGRFSSGWQALGGIEVNCTLNSDPHLYRVDTSSAIPITLSYTDLDEIDAHDIMEGICELNGCFGVFTRDGGLEQRWLASEGEYPSEEIYPSRTAYPAKPGASGILRSMYSTCEYEDEDTLPYAYVSATYTNSSGQSDQYARLWIVDEDEYYENPEKYRGYTCGENYLIKQVKWADADILAALAPLARVISNITYRPATVNMMGLPYLEAGDRIDVNDKDDSFSTYILRRTLKGEHTLRDTVETK